MSRELEPLLGKKARFQGEVAKFGLKRTLRGGYKPIMLLNEVEVAEGSALIADHLWVNVGRTIASLDPRVGSTISFNAWVKDYEKGEYGSEVEVGITRLSALRVEEAGSGPSLQEFLEGVEKKIGGMGRSR